MRKIMRTEFKRLCTSHVCEIMFVRRRPERAPGRPLIRRMICTNSTHILNTIKGRTQLQFRFPKTSFRIDERKHNVVCVWDIFMKDYRNVSMESCFLLRKTPKEEFWQYWDEALSFMDQQDMIQFMDHG